MIKADIVPYVLPLVRPIRLGGYPFSERAGWVLRLEDAEGNVGWGEASPLPGFSRETPHETLRNLEQIAARLAKGETHSGVTDTSAATFALDLALASLEATRTGVPLARVFNPAARSRQSVNAVLLSDEPVDEAVSAVRAGFTVLKMKVGSQSLVQDAERVQAVSAAVGTSALLRLDANRSWRQSEARAFAGMIRGVPIDYIEEPLEESSGLAALAEEGWPIAIDESLAGIEPSALAEMRWLTAVVIKPTIVGGIRRAWRLADEAIKSGIKPVISSALETGIGLRGLVALAAAIGSVDIAAGLDTGRLLRGDVTVPPFAGACQMPTDMVDTFEVSVD
ncbi:MAG: O-succinylbenzoate synthase [Rhodothermales bacterium]|jgi:O-succinylbenzoate synthase